MPDIRSKLTVVPPPSADDYARAETARKNSLFRWADGVLEQIGLAEHVPGKRDQVRLRAGDLAGLAELTLDVDAAAVTLAIQAGSILPAASRRPSTSKASVKAPSRKSSKPALPS